MSQFNANSFSTIGTSTKISSDKQRIQKLVVHECCPQDIVIPLYISYISSLSKSPLYLPTSVYPLDNGVCLEQSVYGRKLFTSNYDIDFDYILFILPQIIDLFHYACQYKIYLDPHLSNFHVTDDSLKLIDVSPPYSTRYNQFVNRKCSSSTERFFLMKNCLFFRWDFLPFHFVGDLTNISHCSTFYFQPLYDSFKSLLPRSTFYSDFIEKSLMIRHHENLRSKLNFNLL